MSVSLGVQSMSELLCASFSRKPALVCVECVKLLDVLEFRHAKTPVVEKGAICFDPAHNPAVDPQGPAHGDLVEWTRCAMATGPLPNAPSLWWERGPSTVENIPANS